MVQVIVHVPPTTPEGRGVFLAGEGPYLGDWSAQGVPLARQADGTYGAELAIPEDFRGQFLVTLGRWREVECDGDGRERLPRVIRGNLRQPLEVVVAAWGPTRCVYHDDFPSQFVRQRRRLIVWLPPGYAAEPQRRFPVFYLHDGQNLFDAATAFAGIPWGVDESSEQLIRAGRVEPVILVGISNTPDRLNEYGPRRCGSGRRDDFSRDYGRFVVEEVKPFIDTHYRTLREPEQTAVGGASMGGLIALHLCQWYPKVFGMCMAMSPSLWWDREYLLRTLWVWPHWLQRCRIWLDVGTQENATPVASQWTVRRTRRLARLLAQYGLTEGQHFRYVEVPGAGHHEAAWGARFPQVLSFFWGRT
ncbi:MAG: alpha/beta hydrolase-fold protein [Gemmataceae bacterium]|nr:alpha/beta hydrolase-fold protein [Gemmata sp.]MDW8199356.1 alpha/beta hydrolase-fold protein [Gemmataceae bacterium]